MQKGGERMAYDGTLKFDTSMNAEGFQKGTEKMSGIASKAFAAIGCIPCFDVV